MSSGAWSPTFAQQWGKLDAGRLWASAEPLATVFGADAGHGHGDRVVPPLIVVEATPVAATASGHDTVHVVDIVDYMCYGLTYREDPTKGATGSSQRTERNKTSRPFHHQTHKRVGSPETPTQPSGTLGLYYIPSYCP
jgi:hypothetical protein